MKRSRALAIVVALTGTLIPFAAAQAGISGKPITVSVPPRVVLQESWRVKGHCPSHKYEKYQYAYSCFAIRENGTVTARTMFSNGKKWDGDHFTADYIFRDMRKRAVARAHFQVGLNGAAFHHGAVERRLQKSVKLSPVQANRIRYVTIAWGRFDKRDDKLIGDTAIKIGCALIGCSAADKKSPEAK